MGREKITDGNELNNSGISFTKESSPLAEKKKKK